MSSSRKPDTSVDGAITSERDSSITANSNQPSIPELENTLVTTSQTGTASPIVDNADDVAETNKTSTPTMLEAVTENPNKNPPVDDQLPDPTISFLEQTLQNLPEEHQSLLPLLSRLGRLHWGRFNRLGDIQDLERAISYESRFIDQAAENNLVMSEHLLNLGVFYESRFRRLGNRMDIDMAVDSLTRAAAMSSDDDANKFVQLHHLGAALNKRFELLDNPGDLNLAISSLDKSLSLAPEGYPSLFRLLNTLGGLYMSRYQRMQAPEDCEQALARLTQAAPLIPNNDPAKLWCLNNLGVAYELRYKRLGELFDLNEAVGYKSLANSLTPEAHHDKPMRLMNLSGSYLSRLAHLGSSEDLDSAVKCMECYITLASKTESGYPGDLASLGGAPRAQSERFGDPVDIARALEFDRLGDSEDLQAGIESSTQSVLLSPVGDAGRCERLNTLGVLYQSRFDRFGDLEDLDQAIDYTSQAVQLASESESSSPDIVNNISTAYLRRFRHRGELIDIDKSISYIKQALKLTPNNHPRAPSYMLNLGLSHATRFDRLGELPDIDQAIEYQRQAVLRTPENSLARPGWQSMLGVSYLFRFGRLGNLADMNLAIESQTEAVMKISNDHASKSKWLNNLGNSYHLRYEHLSQSEDLDKALDYLDQATSLVPENHPDKYAWLYNLHRPYYSRFQARHDPSDLDKAISCQMQAVAFAPKTYAYSAELLEKLGELHQCRFEQSSRHTDLNAAIECFRDSATFSAGFPTIRLEAAHKWAKLCHKVHRSAIEAYTQAMALIPQVAWIGSTTSRRYEYLISHIKHLANEAAVAAIGSGQYALAVEWLEEGRSIVWGQMLQLRTPFDDLSVQDPRLAKELQQVALEVDLASSMNPGRVGVVLTSATSEQVAQSRRRSAERWESLLKDARHLHGFERFLKPKQFSDLKSTSATSTVVLINMHEEQCDALAILPESTDPVHISLPAFSYVKAIQSRHIMDTIQHTRARCNLQQRKPVFLEDDPPDTLENTLNVLWSDIVRPILEHLGYITTRNPADELPRITWCATGLLAFLPLHAAEYYHGNTKERVFDYVVSSYSPTLSALLAPVQPTAQFAGVLGVGEAAPKSAIPLPGTIAELDQLEQIVGSHGVPFTRLDEDRATCDAVLEQIEEHSWVHLACHASQDLFDPTMSSFQLHGGSLSLAAISSKSLKQAQFAFLSACETATGHKQLPDESIHLAAGMIMVGYQAAIATMWSIKDEDAPLVSTKVYKKLLQGGIPQSQRAAVALHEAMAELRGLIGEKEFVRWVPYIHVGK